MPSLNNGQCKKCADNAKDKCFAQVCGTCKTCGKMTSLRRFKHCALCAMKKAICSVCEVSTAKKSP